MKFWFVAPLEQVDLWPDKEHTVMFMGRTFYLRPPKDDVLPDIRMQYEHPDEENLAVETVFQFLSLWSWWYRRPARVGFCQLGSAPIRVGASCMFSFQTGRPFGGDSVAMPTTAEARLAIALYREAKNVNSVPYEFLGYFKILNIKYSSGREQIAWINSTHPLLTDQLAVERLKQLTTKPDIGEYLYGSGRCAVAHASAAPIANPDDRSDLIRLYSDLPVVRSLAEYLIEEELSVKWEHSGHPRLSPKKRPL